MDQDDWDWSDLVRDAAVIVAIWMALLCYLVLAYG